MVLKVYGDDFEVKRSTKTNAQMNFPLCWGTCARAGVEPYGFQLGNWSLTRYVVGMTFDSYLSATTGDEFDPEAVWADRCYCLAGIADRLTELRTVKGIWVHSDLKPNNIVVRPLTADGVRPRRSVELIDTDTLVYMPIAYGGALTPVMAKGCTPRFAPPETLLRGLAERSSDVWSFGVVVFDALTGLHPFGCQGTMDAAAWEELYGGKIEPQLDALLSYEARNLVRRCLDKNPLNRPEPSWLASQLREIALRPPRGYVPQKPNVYDATTMFPWNELDWRERYCVELEPEIEEEPEIEIAIEDEAEFEVELDFDFDFDEDGDEARDEAAARVAVVANLPEVTVAKRPADEGADAFASGGDAEDDVEPEGDSEGDQAPESADGPDGEGENTE